MKMKIEKYRSRDDISPPSTHVKLQLSPFIPWLLLCRRCAYINPKITHSKVSDMAFAVKVVTIGAGDSCWSGFAGVRYMLEFRLWGEELGRGMRREF